MTDPACCDAIIAELGPNPQGIYASVRTRLDVLEARINNPYAPSPNVNNPFFIGGSPDSGVSIQVGIGDPNVILANPPVFGSLFLREDGSDAEGLYSYRPDGLWYPVSAPPF